MLTAHLTYPGLALDKFFVTDPEQDAKSFIQLVERKINFAPGFAPANPDVLATILSAKKLCFLVYSEAQLENGMKATLTLLPHENISEPTLYLDFQMDAISSVIDWKLNAV